MKFTCKTTLPTKDKSDIILLGIHKDAKLTPIGKEIDKASGGHLSKVLKNGDIQGKTHQTLLLHDIPNIQAKRLLLVGLGDSTPKSNDYVNSLRSAFSVVKGLNCQKVISYLSETALSDKPLNWQIEQSVAVVSQDSYQSDKLKSKEKRAKPIAFKEWCIHIVEKNKRAAQKHIKASVAIANGVKYCKDLGNLPGNICTPTFLAQEARKITNGVANMKTSILDEKAMSKLGMEALLAVSRGSEQKAKLITMEYHGAAKTQKPVVLVGKGITFDTGGISLKPGPAMDEMKFDMCGAASVFGVMRALKELKPAINVVGIVAAAENMPGGRATKPGDIVKTLSGQTVEILNTDAEGRLVLCDALTYAKKYKPATVIDIATLTGAMIIALGYQISGVFCEDDKLLAELQHAADESSDRIWQLPIPEDYQSGLDSNFADMANIAGDRSAGSIMAACFLSRFTKEYRWAHLDIAGVAWQSGKQKGATGRPVPLLMHYLLNTKSK